METVNSLSGGKTSSYMAVHYPADHNVFSLVRTSDTNLIFPDAKIRQLVSDRIGTEFIGTLEQDEIIYTILDLEQYIGREISWITGPTFEEAIEAGIDKDGRSWRYLPNVVTRYCTEKMKVFPIRQWCYDNTNLPVDMRIGFRPTEMSRAKRMLERGGEDGILMDKFVVGHSKTGRNRWRELPYRKVSFPLIEDNIHKDTIELFWKDKPVRFAYMNNCVGCFHRNEMLLKHMSDKEPVKFDWFVRQEVDGARFKKEVSYEKIRSYRTQFQLFDEDFDDCDSGYCGL